jgi:hypothetical protein
VSGELRHLTGTPPVSLPTLPVRDRDRGRRRSHPGHLFGEELEGAGPAAPPAAVPPPPPAAHRDPVKDADAEVGGELDVIA